MQSLDRAETLRLAAGTCSNVGNGRPVRVDDVTSSDAEYAEFLQEMTRDRIDQYGGEVCSSHYQSGDGHVVSSTGANGQAFPPGGTASTFLTGPAKLRAQ